MYFSYDHLQLRYEPFRIGLAKPLMEEATYRSMIEAYPPLELFQHIPKVGNKYCLSQKFQRPHAARRGRAVHLSDRGTRRSELAEPVVRRWLAAHCRAAKSRRWLQRAAWSRH